MNGGIEGLRTLAQQFLQKEVKIKEKGGMSSKEGYQGGGDALSSNQLGEKKGFSE